MFVLRFLTQLLERHVEAPFQARHSQEHEYAIIWVVVQETLDRVAHHVHDYGRSEVVAYADVRVRSSLIACSARRSDRKQLQGHSALYVRRALEPM